MGYTHYLEMNDKAKLIADTDRELHDEIQELFRDVYRDMLRRIVVDGRCLESWFYDEGKRDEYFHEYCTNEDGGPTIRVGKDFSFCKTARKAYDPAVRLVYKIAEELGYADFSSDGDNKLPDQAYFMKELNMSGLDAIRMENLAEDCYESWKWKIIQLQESIENWEDTSPYTAWNQITDTDLEYIAENVKKGNHTVHLDRGVVQISLLEDSNTSYK